MRKFVKLLTIIALLSGSVSYSAELPKIMVWHIKAGSGISGEQVRKFEEELLKSLKTSGRFSVLSLQKRDDFFNEVGAPSPDCVTNECFFSAGKSLGVDWILYGDIGRAGDSLLLNLGMINVHTGKVGAFFSKRLKADALFRSGDEGVKALLAQLPSGQGGTVITVPSGKYGVVIIRSKPSGAMVYLDAEPVGRTPTAYYEVSEGEHALTFVLEGYQTTHTPLTIKAGEVKEIEEILLMRTGDVEISSNPSGATLYVDGKKVGVTPQKLEGVLVGIHEIRLEFEGYAPLRATITVDESTLQKRSFTLKKEGARVLISSRPDGATVLVDGRAVGNALYIGEVEAGTHTITVRMPGYAPQSKQVELKASGSYAFHFHLQPGMGGDTPRVVPSPVPTLQPVIAPQRRGAFSSSNPEAQKLYDQASAHPDINERIKLYQQAIALDPKFAPAHNDLGVDYTELGRWDDAIREYRIALEIDPDYAFAHNNLGYVYLNTGRVEEAIAHFKEALRIDPDYVTAHFNLGKAYFLINNYEASIKEFETVIKLNPRHAGAYFQMGRVLKRMERYDDAILMYLKCLEMDPTYIDAYYNLGDLYEAKGDSQSAIYYFRKYISVETRPSEQEWIEKARERIKALGGQP